MSKWGPRVRVRQSLVHVGQWYAYCPRCYWLDQFFVHSVAVDHAHQHAVKHS